jgi:endonuclease YncB( thermonuclease family)
MSKVPWSWPDSVVTRVIDGDSLVARVTRDLGFHGEAVFETRLRLNRINAPKLSTPHGKDAAARVAELVATALLMIETVEPYKYGDEWMAEITFPDGRNLSDQLVREGYAVYWDGTGPRPADG